jgi:hypothetical protein
MTLKDFIEKNQAIIMPDGPLNTVFGPSGMLKAYEENKDKSKRILIWYFHNFGTYYSLRSIVVDDKGYVIEKNWYENQISRN